MTVETSKSILSVFGIVDIIFGIFELIFGALVTLGGGMLASGRISAEGNVTTTMVFMAGSFFLLLGLFSLGEGILSRRAAKDLCEARSVFYMAAISLVLAVGSLVSVSASSGSPASAIVCVVINVLLILAANTLRKDEVTA